MKSFQILSGTMHKGKHHDQDLDLLVNPAKSDLTEVKKKQSHAHEHAHDHLHLPIQQSNTAAYFLLIALCIDGFFEGIAIGVQSKYHSVLFISIAVIINKLAVAFSLGINLKKTSTELQTFIRFIILFGLFCPTGILLGYFMKSAISRGSLLALSSGTFIYVSCSVIMVEEFSLTKYRYTKYLCFFIGSLLAAGMNFLTAMD
jgi:zinc transporter ZupT